MSNDEPTPPPKGDGTGVPARAYLCRFPGCCKGQGTNFLGYAATDGVRKHGRKYHRAWLHTCDKSWGDLTPEERKGQGKPSTYCSIVEGAPAELEGEITDTSMLEPCLKKATRQTTAPVAMPTAGAQVDAMAYAAAIPIGDAMALSTAVYTPGEFAETLTQEEQDLFSAALKQPSGDLLGDLFSDRVEWMKHDECASEPGSDIGRAKDTCVEYPCVEDFFTTCLGD